MTIFSRSSIFPGPQLFPPQNCRCPNFFRRRCRSSVLTSLQAFQERNGASEDTRQPFNALSSFPCEKVAARLNEDTADVESKLQLLFTVLPGLDKLEVTQRNVEFCAALVDDPEAVMQRLLDLKQEMPELDVVKMSLDFPPLLFQPPLETVRAWLYEIKAGKNEHDVRAAVQLLQTNPSWVFPDFEAVRRELLRISIEQADLEDLMGERWEFHYWGFKAEAVLAADPLAVRGMELFLPQIERKRKNAGEALDLTAIIISKVVGAVPLLREHPRRRSIEAEALHAAQAANISVEMYVRIRFQNVGAAVLHAALQKIFPVELESLVGEYEREGSLTRIGGSTAEETLCRAIAEACGVRPQAVAAAKESIRRCVY